MLSVLSFMENLGDELENSSELFASTTNLRITMHLIRGHLEGRLTTMTSLIGASRAPYATANRRIKDMQEAGLIDQRPRTVTGKSFSLHPSVQLLDQWTQLTSRVQRLASSQFGGAAAAETSDYYFGGSYLSAKSIPPMEVLSEPLKLAGAACSGAWRSDLHGDGQPETPV
ncbi:hypothetical protein [Sulfitobacter sediminilitoris]|uniref:hypothetical protein n=1 Tax=Sulfitobacter sediminilitoris TaxID=2698830 RepID=UPI00360CD06D